MGRGGGSQTYEDAEHIKNVTSIPCSGVSGYSRVGKPSRDFSGINKVQNRRLGPRNATILTRIASPATDLEARLRVLSTEWSNIPRRMPQGCI